MNNYIYEYYQAINDGSVTVGKWIRLWYQQVVKGLEEKAYVFSPKSANKVITFIESFCHHQEGRLAPGLLKLELWQKAFLSVVFGILDDKGRRQFREVLLVEGRKNGKTLLASAVASYMAFLDGEYGAKIYFCAPKLDQAKICYNAFVQTVSQEEELAKMSKKRRNDVYIESSNTTVEKLAYNDKKSDGLNPHLVVCDEISAWTGDRGLKQYEVIQSSLGGRDQPLVFSITTANYFESEYDELMRRASAVLQGTSREKRFAPFVYQIDDIEKWNDINEIQKAMPNLGVSVSVDFMLEEIAKAEASLPKKAEFLTKYCNIKQNSSLAWLDAQTIRKCVSEPFKLEDFRDCYAVMGIDLSRTTDLTCAVLLVEKEGTIYCFSRFYLPSNRIEEATIRDQIPYAQYIRQGFLFASGENFVNYEDVFAWAREIVEKYRIYPLQVGYDRYCSQYLVQDMKQYGFHMDDVFQGENLTPVIREAEGLMKDGKIKIGNNELMKIHMLNSALKVNNETERVRLIKVEQRAHIDGMASLLDALCVRQKYWQEIGAQLINERRT